MLWLASGHRSQTFPVEGINILDLEVVSEPTEPIHTQGHGKEAGSHITTLNNKITDPGGLSASTPTHQPPHHVSQVSPTRQQPFIDPAILSFGRPPLKAQNLAPKEQLGTGRLAIPLEMLAEAAEKRPARVTSTVPFKASVLKFTERKIAPSNSELLTRTDSMVTATLSGPFNHLTLTENIESIEQSDTGEIGPTSGRVENALKERQMDEQREASIKYPGRRSRRGGKSRGSKQEAAPATENLPEHARDINSSPAAKRKRKARTITEGQRGIPFSQGIPRTVLPSSLTINGSSGRNVVPSKIKGRRERMRASEAQNGWATEEATDIQEMGDFDFEANLSKFDKHEIFNQIRHDDTTADEDRLVSHNRLPARLGTGGGRNLHFTENVLDSPKLNGCAKWNSEAGDSEGNTSDARISSGRSSRRATSRATGRKPPSRKGSAMASDNKQRTSLGLVTDSLARARYSSFERNGSPKPKQNNMSASPYAGSLNTSRSSLRLTSSNRICPCLSPLQMLEFEQLAVSELGLTEDIMTENAARGIAETVLGATRMLGNELEKVDQPHKSVIAILAGNNRSGARAIAGGRHLQNHGVQVITCVLGLERDDDLLDSVRQQMHAYRKCGASLIKANEMLEGMKGARIKPDLVVDALFGMHICFDDLRRDDQAVCFELVRWVNRNEVEVLSVDVPSGVDASSGMLMSLMG